MSAGFSGKTNKFQRKQTEERYQYSDFPWIGRAAEEVPHGCLDHLHSSKTLLLNKDI